MQLSSHSYGKGQPLIILHGLFGSSDNWHTVGKKLADRFWVFTIDQRNHGRSPHNPTMTFDAMAQDMKEFLEQHDIPSAFLLGHSMGGKTAMRVALRYPGLVNALIVVDIAPRKYPPHHDYIFDAVLALDLGRYSSRKEIDASLSSKISSLATRQLIMKNLARDENNAFRWKMNLDAIQRNYDRINEAIQGEPFSNPTLFVRGENSIYIQQSDEAEIRNLFPNSRLITVQNAGHWVHADAPDEFARAVLDFLQKQS